MCRPNQLWGCALTAFALGLLIGTWLEKDFFSICIGIGILCCGFGCLRKK